MELLFAIIMLVVIVGVPAFIMDKIGEKKEIKKQRQERRHW